MTKLVMRRVDAAVATPVVTEKLGAGRWNISLLVWVMLLEWVTFGDFLTYVTEMEEVS